VTIELIQLKQEASKVRDALNIDLLFEVEGKCYWRRIEMDATTTVLADGQAVAPWKELLYVVNKQLLSVQAEHTNESVAMHIHPDLTAAIERLEQMVKA
jgi:hypothetical protein